MGDGDMVKTEDIWGGEGDESMANSSPLLMLDISNGFTVWYWKEKRLLLILVSFPANGGTFEWDVSKGQASQTPKTVENKKTGLTVYVGSITGIE